MEHDFPTNTMVTKISSSLVCLLKLTFSDSLSTVEMTSIPLAITQSIWSVEIYLYWNKSTREAIFSGKCNFFLKLWFYNVILFCYYFYTFPMLCMSTLDSVHLNVFIILLFSPNPFCLMRLPDIPSFVLLTLFQFLQYTFDSKSRLFYILQHKCCNF